MSKGNEAWEKLDREMSAKYGHLLRKRIDLHTPGVRYAPTKEFPADPEQDLADDCEPNETT